MAKATPDIASVEREHSSFVGLEQPLIDTGDPGPSSFPTGFRAELLGAGLGRDGGAERLWGDASAHQNTGVLASTPSLH